MQILRGLYSPDTNPVAITIGNFDGVHLGHQTLLDELRAVAQQRGLKTAVVIFEPHPREFFTPQQAPVRLTSLREKLEQFREIGVDRVHVCRFNARFAKMSAADFVHALSEKMHAKFVLIGDDFRFGSGRVGDFALMEKVGLQRGFDVRAMHSVLHDGVRVSSTAVRAALADGKIRLARGYLDRRRKLGFPTANLQLKHNQPPLKGIYVVEVHSDGLGVLQGVASLGVRPTVKQDAKPVLEVHLFEFDRQIYGRHLRVEFLEKLRDEEKYPSLEALTRQIALDVENTKKWFREHE
ncbi:MAG: riboflavin kinase / FMN adenylyltransferase [Gallionellaceae bacterium]|nr:MAG: riboflavin kinase / FMN adenylyltransferase [Gallionellaceae bacterium]